MLQVSWLRFIIGSVVTALADIGDFHMLIAGRTIRRCCQRLLPITLAAGLPI